MIDTREELVNALSEAAEIEHGLMIQYLFASFTCKRGVDEGITPIQQSLIADWESVILKVAHEEMYHLANVCNLLSAIGAAPNFGRPNFPQSLKSYYPFDFQLERLNDSSMYRFVVFELPKDEPPPAPPRTKMSDHARTADFALLEAAPDPLVYNHVGELYRKIQEGFNNIPEDQLFIGPKQNRDYEDWGLRLRLHLVSDRATALKAIDEIVEEGEGSSSGRENSHYKRFVDLRETIWAAISKSTDFSPSRLVATNPLTREQRDTSGAAALIENETSRECVELFNDVYASVLQMLVQYYSYDGESESQRKMLRDSTRRLMSSAIRPLGEVTTQLPLKDDNDELRAGPSFEIYSSLRLPPEPANRWTMLRERFELHIQATRSLAQKAGQYPALKRLSGIADNLTGTVANLSTEF